MIGLDWTRIAIYAAVVLAIFTTGAGIGYHRGVKKLWDYQVEQAKEAVKIVVKQGAVTERVVTKYLKGQDRVRVVTQTIEKEVVRYAESNPGSCLDARWRVLHDAAAAGTLPPPPSTADGTNGAPAASAAIETASSNYAACRRTSDRLTGLQEWVREQENAAKQ